MAALGVVAVCLSLLAGCAEETGVGAPQTGATSGTAAPSGPLSPAVGSAALRAQKKAAGIADCPSSDPHRAAVPGGLPDVVLPCLGGGPAVRLAGLWGTPLIVNVWAQWCGPCRQEAPYLAEVAAGHPKGVLILGVDYVDGVQPERAVEFARVVGWRFPQLADPDKALAAPLQIAGPPQTFFVRSDGTIAYRHSGPFTSAQQIRDLAERHLRVRL